MDLINIFHAVRFNLNRSSYAWDKTNYPITRAFGTPRPDLMTQLAYSDNFPATNSIF